MNLKLFGTRGSIPICRKDSQHSGGNTTCLRILSSCIPKSEALILDAGSGYYPFGKECIKEDISVINLLFTHYHHDHTQGLILADTTYYPTIQHRVMGPIEQKQGVQQMLEGIMHPPLFPVPYSMVKQRFHCSNLTEEKVILIHPTAGIVSLSMKTYTKAENTHHHVMIHKQLCDIHECLIITSYRTYHPDYTLSYRIDEKPTGKIFVFLTDHENTETISPELIHHVRDANLLIEDCQYSIKRYAPKFGHATPDYCVRLAKEGKVHRLGLTHFDPSDTDEDIAERLVEAKKSAKTERFSEKHIFTCRDYMEIDVSL